MKNWPPIRFYLDGWDWYGQGTRRSYVVSLLVFALPTFVIWLLFFELPDPSLAKNLMFIFISLTIVPSWGHMLRRLNGIGRSGWWALACLFPLFGWIVTIWLIFAKSKGQANGGIARKVGYAFCLLMAVGFIVRLFVAPFYLPSGSMKPALLPGDYVLAMPTRSGVPGDILFFNHPTKRVTYVKRLIAVGGDQVQMIDGQVFVNGSPLRQAGRGQYVEVYAKQGPYKYRPICQEQNLSIGDRCTKFLMAETMADGREYMTLDIMDRNSDNTPIFDVPEGHYFFLGDHRDNSIDSRMALPHGIGFVPQGNVVYRPRWVLFSAQGALWNFTKWRRDRFWVRVE